MTKYARRKYLTTGRTFWKYVSFPGIYSIPEEEDLDILNDINNSNNNNNNMSNVDKKEYSDIDTQQQIQQKTDKKGMKYLETSMPIKNFKKQRYNALEPYKHHHVKFHAIFNFLFF